MTIGNSVSPRRRIVALCAITALLLLLMLPNMIWLRFGYGDFHVWVNAAIMPTSLLLLLFALLGDAPWLACLLLAPFALMAPMEAFYVGNYHHPTTPEILATIVATNPREIREYLGDSLTPLLASVAIALLFPLLAAWWILQARLRWRHNSRKWVLVVLLVVPLMAGVMSAMESSGNTSARVRNSIETMSDLGEPIQYGYPFGMLYRFAEYHDEWTEMRANVARMDGFRFHAQQATSLQRRQIYVLVIGEASRRDHWQLFGYARATNPELSRLRNIVPIPNMDSAWPESITAIPMVLTRKPVTERSPNWHEASILRAMEEAGYDTWWISNQMPIGLYDSPVSSLAFEARHVDFRNHTSWSTPGTYDEDLLQPLREALADSNRNLFIVLHLMGSHQRYDFRYPDTYKRFQPTELGSDGGMTAWERTRNSYDNSILYTDHVLAEVIGILQGSGSVTALWYESDHGEALPSATCKLEGHGNGTRYEYEISALFWSSDAYVAAFPMRVAAIRTNAGKRTMSADTFESLIDMSGVTYPGHDASLSLFSTQWRYRPRMVNYPWKVDIDRASFGRDCQIVLPE